MKFQFDKSTKAVSLLNRLIEAGALNAELTMTSYDSKGEVVLSIKN